MPKTIAIDFDGVIHAYSKGWHDGTIYDEPIPGAFEAIKAYMDQGYAVYILSTRKPRQILKWFKAHNHLGYHDAMAGPDYPNDWVQVYGYDAEKIGWRTKFWNKDHVLGVTNRKLPAIAYIDDRAVKFDGKWDGPTLTRMDREMGLM